MRAMRAQSALDRVRMQRQEVQDKKRVQFQEIQDLRKKILESECRKALAATGNTIPQEDKTKRLLSLAADIRRKKDDKTKEEERSRIKAETRKRAEARRQEIEVAARESKEADAIRRTMKVLHDSWSTDPKVRACRRTMITRLAVESTDPEDRDQTVEYIRLSKAIKLMENDPEELSRLPSLGPSSSSSSSSDSSSSSSESDERNRKGEKRKRSGKKMRSQKKKKGKKD